MSFLDDVKADCLEAEADLGNRTMLWSGFSYPVAQSTIRKGAVLLVGGREVEIKLTLRVRYDGTKPSGQTWDFSLADLPKHGDIVHYLGTDYRIAQVNNAHSTFLEIDLADRNR